MYVFPVVLIDTTLIHVLVSQSWCDLNYLYLGLERWLRS